jgi:hypothetical protein
VPQLGLHARALVGSAARKRASFDGALQLNARALVGSAARKRAIFDGAPPA